MRRLMLLGALLASFAAHAGVKPGDVPPSGLGETHDGQPIHLAALRGQVVVISFWATWCRYCMRELPVLAGLQTLATQRRLPLQVIAIDDQESREVYLRAVHLMQPRLPGLLLGWDRNGDLGRPFGTDKGIPVMVLLRRNGSIAYLHAGYGEDMLDRIVDEINALIQEPSPPPVASSI